MLLTIKLLRIRKIKGEERMGPETLKDVERKSWKTVFSGTNETVERFYKMADERKVTLGALLELALDALEQEATLKAPLDV